MRGAGIDLLRAADLDERSGSAAEGTGGIDHIVEQDDGLAFHVADDVHNLGLVGDLAALIDDGEVHVEFHGNLAGAGHAAHVGGDDHHVGVALAELLQIVIGEEGSAAHVVHGDIEEALDLVGVQVHGKYAVGAGGLDDVRNELCGDGVAALRLAVLTGVAEVRDDSGDTTGAGTVHRVDHDEQLHQVVVHGLAGRLHDEHIRAADGLKDGNGAFAVGEALNVGLAEGLVEMVADAFRQSGIGVSGEYLDFFAV